MLYADPRSEGLLHRIAILFLDFLHSLLRLSLFQYHQGLVKDVVMKIRLSISNNRTNLAGTGDTDCLETVA